MKKLNTIFFVSLIVFTNCNDCNDCGKAVVHESKYSIVNSLDRELIVSFYGEGQTLFLNILPKDTSKKWTRVLTPPPGGGIDLGLFFTKSERTSEGFPFNSDSIVIADKNEVLRSFPINFLNNDSNWESSIYLDESPPFIIIEGEDEISHYFYLLDSTNLNLN